MSDIKAGDLVMVVKGMPCCGNGGKIGHIFTVVSIGAYTSQCAGYVRAIDTRKRYVDKSAKYRQIRCCNEES